MAYFFEDNFDGSCFRERILSFYSEGYNFLTTPGPLEL